MSGSRTGHQSHDPAWASPENDAKHRSETAPLLFGEGELSLQDPEGATQPPLRPYEDPTEKAFASKPSNDEEDDPFGSYQKPVHNDDDDDEEEESDEESNKDGKAGRNNAKKTVKKKRSGDYGSIMSRAAKFMGTKPKKKKEPLVPLKDTDMITIVDEPRQNRAAMLKPHVPKQNPCLWMFHVLQGLNICSAVCLLTTQVLPLLFLPVREVLDRFGVESLALRVYVALFCVLFILIESDAPVSFIHTSTFLQHFVSRGFLYSFLGLVCVNQSYAERVKEIVETGQYNLARVQWAAIFMQLSSWLMLGTGVLYMLMEICCLKRLKDRLKEKESISWSKYRHAMKVWKEWKELNDEESDDDDAES